MDDQTYERDEELLEARRLRRMEMKRKRMIRNRLILGGAALVLLLLIVLIARGCGKKEETVQKPQVPAVTAPEPEPEPNKTESKTTKATLAAVGDIMVYASQAEDAKKEDGSYDFLPSLASVSTLLTASDLTVGNFEANFSGEPFSGFPDFSAPPSLADTLASLGFDILQTANTYSIQKGLSGLSGTVNTIRKAGMDTLGTYLSAEDKAEHQVVVRDVNGIKIAFIAFTKSVNNMTLPTGSDYAVDLLCTDYDTTYNSLNKDAINAAVSAAKAKDPDVIVAMLHWGSEFESSISPLQESAADLLISSGVDVILGTHPHIVGKMEFKDVKVGGKDKRVFIAYSLGNFLVGNERGQASNAPGSFESVVLNLEFTKENGETSITGCNYVPLYIMDNGADAINRYQVRNVYDVLDNNPSEEDRTRMEETIAHLKANTESDFDRGN